MKFRSCKYSSVEGGEIVHCRLKLLKKSSFLVGRGFRYNKMMRYKNNYLRWKRGRAVQMGGELQKIKFFDAIPALVVVIPLIVITLSQNKLIAMPALVIVITLSQNKLIAIPALVVKTQSL